ncbi:hypothetical protein ACFOGQ_17880 [Acinetobacter vivianii]
MKLDYAESLRKFSETFNLSKEETSKGNDQIPGGLVVERLPMARMQFSLSEVKANMFIQLKVKNYSI